MLTKSNHWKFNFFTIYIGQAISQFSSSVLQMAIVWYLIANDASSVLIALSGIMAFLPQGFLGLFIGVFIDRYSRKNIMIISDLVIALASLTLVLSPNNEVISPQLILVVLFIRSVGTAFHTPCLQAVTAQIVPADQLTKCAGYSQTLQSISLILSPAVAAALFAIWNLNHIILLDVIGALIASLSLLMIKIPKLDITPQTSIHLIKEAKEGIRLLTEKKLLFFMSLNALFSVIYMPLFVLYPMMTLNYFNKSAYHAGVVEIMFGIGMLLGSLLLGKLPPIKNKYMIIGYAGMIMSLSMILSGLLPLNGFILFVVFSAILGVASPFYQGLQATVFQELISEHYLGRVMSLTGSLLVIGTPVGIFLAGIIADIIGVQTYFAFSGLFMLIISIFYFKEKNRND